MNIRIGVDDTNAEVCIDATARARIALLGAPGCGKTTTCRYLARRWLSIHCGSCLIITPRPYEYGNLDVVAVQEASQISVPDQPSLLIVDEADLLAPGVVERAVNSERQLVIVASFGQAVADLASSEDEAAGVEFHATYALEHLPRLDAAPVQSRLDWPPNTIPVFLDQRRPIDFPLHKWAM